MSNRNYKREYLRKHYATGLYVSNDGEYAERDTKNGVYKYPVYREECGRAFIVDRYYGKLFLDELTLTCFLGQAPKDGKTYYPHHIDGDMRNAHTSNLQWREQTPYSMASYIVMEREAWYKNRKITANKKGQIKQRTQILPIIDYLYDADLDWTYHYPLPWVRYEEKNRWGGYDTRKIYADKVFEELGLVNGDKSNFYTPVILHRNNDYMDYSFRNLEWCDANDPRYKIFDKIRHDMVMKKDHDANYRLDERSWDIIYRGCEPYQDWTDKPEKRLFKFH